jgi:ribosomal protein S18 acetylase RimI-like enzyme
MTYAIRPFARGDYHRVLHICVSAFTPIHEGFEKALGPEIFARQYDGWKDRYADDLIRLTNAGPQTQVHVAEREGVVVGFVTTTMEEKTRVGEIGLNAVLPAHQGKGAGKAMYAFALDALKARGAEVAYVGTGADAAHAPARAAYEAMGFDKSIPSVHYFRKL